MEIKDLFQRPLEYLQHLFITGLLFLLPIAITFSIFNFFLHVIKKMLIPIKNLDMPIINQIPQYEILLLIIFIFIIGVLIKTFILNPIMHVIDKSFSKVPMINSVYKGIKQLVYAFSSHDQTSFKKVVMVQYPRPGIYSIGFLTKDIPSEISKDNLVGVYIPHTPNPASGNFIMISSEHIQEIDLTRQEATALIISGGIVQPNRFKK